MIKRVPSRQFFILVVLLIIAISAFRHPYFKAKYSSSYRVELFNQFQAELSANEFDPEHYWEFRERFSPGTFLRDEENTGFFGTFRITSVQEGLTPLFYYTSSNLRSLDGLTSGDTGSALENITKEFPGELVSKGDDFVLIKATDTEYVFAFVEPIPEMQRVVGMFDFIPKEKELLKNKLWYNATYLQVK